MEPAIETFGPIDFHSETTRDWYARHAPTVHAWLDEMRETGDPWTDSAKHAAYCLVSNREMFVSEPSWDGFHVGDFLFVDLWEGGTHSLFGSHAVFFDHVLEALRRFADDGLIEREAADGWLAELLAARSDWVRCFAAGTPPEESHAIADQYRKPIESTPRPDVAPSATPAPRPARPKWRRPSRRRRRKRRR